MGIFHNLLNNLRFNEIEKISKDASYSIGYYGTQNEKQALLYNGHIVKKNIKWATKSMMKNDQDSNIINHVAVLDNDGELFIFDSKGKNLSPKGLCVTADPNFFVRYGVYGYMDDPKEVIVSIDNSPSGVSTSKVILYLDRQVISPAYEEVHSYNKFKQRKVKARCGISHYIDKKGNIASANFLDESELDINGNKIQTIFNLYGDRAKILVNEQNKPISDGFDDIVIEKYNVYRCFNRKNQKYTYLLPDGKQITDSKDILTSSTIKDKIKNIENSKNKNVKKKQSETAVDCDENCM